MSTEIMNQRHLDRARTLPGRDEETTDVSRGYVGWGPHEDYVRTVEHSDWEAALAAIQNPVREIHDYYFEVETPSRQCDCCAGSGRSKDYAELAEGFYGCGGGRWAGWGEGPLLQNEIDALVQKGRISPKGKERITPANVDRYLGRMGHDSINRWILTPIRAKNIGVDCNECFDCVGSGYVPIGPTRISLCMWTFDVETGTSRVDTAERVELHQIEEVQAYLKEMAWEGVQRRFGWASGHNLYNRIRYDREFQKNPVPGDRGWSSDYAEEVHASGILEGKWDVDLNLIFDYRIVVEEAHFKDNENAYSTLPDTPFDIHIWMTHPRKGADRLLVIRGCTAEMEPDIKAYLMKSYAVHGRHFAWANGVPFGNEIEPDRSADAKDDKSETWFW